MTLQETLAYEQGVLNGIRFALRSLRTKTTVREALAAMAEHEARCTTIVAATEARVEAHEATASTGASTPLCSVCWYQLYATAPQRPAPGVRQPEILCTRCGIYTRSGILTTEKVTPLPPRQTLDK